MDNRIEELDNTIYDILEDIEIKLSSTGNSFHIPERSKVSTMLSKALTKAGYTRQPEPPPDRVEAVALRLGQYKLGHCPPETTEAICDDLKSDCAACYARQILKVAAPELTEREIFKLTRTENGNFCFYEDGEKAEIYTADENSYHAIIPIKMWRHFNKILDKRVTQLAHDQKQIKENIREVKDGL